MHNAKKIISAVVFALLIASTTSGCGKTKPKILETPFVDQSVYEMAYGLGFTIAYKPSLDPQSSDGLIKYPNIEVVAFRAGDYMVPSNQLCAPNNSVSTHHLNSACAPINGRKDQLHIWTIPKNQKTFSISLLQDDSIVDAYILELPDNVPCNFAMWYGPQPFLNDPIPSDTSDASLTDTPDSTPHVNTKLPTTW